MDSYHLRVKEAKTKGLTRRRAIVLNCRDTCCCNENYHEDDWGCQNCPLFPYKYGKMPKGESANRQRAINEYCRQCCNGYSRKEACCSESCYLESFGHDIRSNPMSKNPSQSAYNEQKIVDSNNLTRQHLS